MEKIAEVIVKNVSPESKKKMEELVENKKSKYAQMVEDYWNSIPPHYPLGRKNSLKN